MLIKRDNKNVVRGFSLTLVPLVTLSGGEGSKRIRRFFAEPVLSDMRFFAALRMTKGKGSE